MAGFQAELTERDIKPFGAVTEKFLSPTEGIVGGRKVILAGTNNYLGLAYDQRCIDAAQRAAQDWGTGTTGSRLANGSFVEHELLEQELADFYGVGHAISFTTGYSATMGMCATIAGPGDVILLDSDSHASIYAGVQLSGAEIIRFKHSNPDDLAKRLRRLGDRVSNTLIVVEGIYSMLGDTAPLQEFAEVKREYGGYLMVDEAHSLGVLGATGRGAAEATGVEADVDFIAGTYSKSLGSTGGYCVSQHAMLDIIRYCIRAYIFTASASPSTVASTRKALEIMRQEPELRAKLWSNANKLYSSLQDMGLSVGPTPSPVVAVELGDREQAILCWNALMDAGVYVNLVIPPASPSTNFLLRCSVSAAHTEEQINHIINAYAALLKNGAISVRAE
ncbi:aminotransferase class I/II-fold pyridoxal phosphate-dependent enzyme [Halieaceae bacterium IMCC14734]|uniref:Aminotransferase class I/II-fold pyridoxal phosphate-dependent enzyme n=2 Tax=Candidatus Litorirhabdus singularis TaxID=2518993 RepID=A0ABT3TJH6_9GAMM|nr:aminotransferase class I/II-fold pyridoxal phosphate-dependent enzyme [Candidatus Litorirhabdus singularis]